ncbi:dephospho-CoA kinase [Nitrosospira sp. Nsp5]|uniref:Dephospho-CoA kinase n=1 Tax=Nitrosospira multiformis TaxID=1231 RepID=A0ABY0TQ56_9PROT|nr:MULTISPECIES: dephospho-CoA kinase [Nitrosospira]PTR10108.1 dephospho-CoA kinase [Nitrosospira sp. Nsp5]SDQ97248.1 dephospho-CoA kinase [Nitrosospira multiformis]
MSLIIGLTGGIGSGKTTAAKFFALLGADVVDTDAIAHELTQPQGAAIPAIRKIFTGKFITAEGALDRKEMRTLVFSDDGWRRELEAILHPLIRIEVARRAALFSAPYGIVVVPLLLETGGYREMIQRILVVDCNEHEQIARAMARTGMDEQTVHAIMASQLSRQERLRRADDVIANDADVLHLRQQVDALHKKYLALASKG